jgi:hypothetical protein
VDEAELLLDARDEKRHKKADKQSDGRPLDPWERYRALLDLVDHYTDSLEICDRRTRFALVVMSALNALNLIIAARPDLFNADRIANSPALRVYTVTYGIFALCCFVYAINVLRPRLHMTSKADREIVTLRFLRSIAVQSEEQFRDHWRNATVGQLWEETAVYAQQTGAHQRRQVPPLDGVFRALFGLTMLTAGFITVVAFVA